jgi:sugar phosphate isomerase/epimerase
MHPRLSVHTVGFGPRPVREFAGPLADHGIGRIGVPVEQLENGGFAANLAALRSVGVGVLDVVQPLAFTLPDPASWPAERDRLRTCVDLAAEAGAPIVYVTTGAAGRLTWDEAAARFAEAVAPVTGHARASGVTLAVENTTTVRADLGFIHGVRDLVDLADLASISACADLCAAWTDRDLREAITRGVSRFALVQIADFVLGTRQTPDRAVPGDGDIPIERQLRWLAEAGYAGPIELELLGPRITAEGPVAAAARAVRTVSPWL